MSGSDLPTPRKLALLIEWFCEPPHFGDRRIQACAVVVFCMAMIILVYLCPSAEPINTRIIDCRNANKYRRNRNPAAAVSKTDWTLRSCSEHPVGVGKWGAVKHLPEEPPIRETLVHQATEPVVVMPDEQMCHLVHDDVFRHSGRFLARSVLRRIFPASGVAAPPFGLHPLHIEPLTLLRARVPIWQSRAAQPA